MHVDITAHRPGGAALIGTTPQTNGRILRANNKLAALLGSTPAALTGSRMCDYIHPQDRPRAEDAFVRLIRGARNLYEMTGDLLAADGSARRVTAYASLVTADVHRVVLIRVLAVPE
jgi:PAS domain S-box-containing protein